MVSDRPFKFHIHIPWGKTLSLVQKSRSSVKVKVKYQGHSFRKNGRYGALVFHIHSLMPFKYQNLAYFLLPGKSDFIIYSS